jgi:hypothetical protein
LLSVFVLEPQVPLFDGCIDLIQDEIVPRTIYKEKLRIACLKKEFARALN